MMNEMPTSKSRHAALITKPVHEYARHALECCQGSEPTIVRTACLSCVGAAVSAKSGVFQQLSTCYASADKGIQTQAHNNQHFWLFHERVECRSEHSLLLVSAATRALIPCRRSYELQMQIEQQLGCQVPTIFGCCVLMWGIARVQVAVHKGCH